MKISQARVRELFGYREGKIFWIKPTSNRVRFGLEAGSITRRGYKAVSAGWQACDRSSSARQYMKKNACEVGP